MPKIICKCGYTHDLSPIPDEGYIMVKDKDYEKLLEVEQKRERLHFAKQGTKEFDELINLDGFVFSHIDRVYVCPKCGYLVWKKDNDYKFYKPE